MQKSTIAGKNSPASGTTLPETLIVIGILGVLAALASPALSELVLNHRLRGLAAQYHSHINWARSHAVQAGQRVHVKVASTEDGSCYIIFTGDVTDCSCANSEAPCGDPAQHLLSSHFPHKMGVSVGTSSKSAYMSFDPLRGTTTPTQTVIFQAVNGNSIHHVTNLMGRTRTCSPTAFNGLKRC